MLRPGAAVAKLGPSIVRVSVQSVSCVLQPCGSSNYCLIKA